MRSDEYDALRYASTNCRSFILDLLNESRKRNMKKKSVYIIIRQSKLYENGWELHQDREIQGKYFDSLPEAKTRVEELIKKYNQEYVICKSIILAKPKSVPVQYTKIKG